MELEKHKNINKLYVEQEGEESNAMRARANFAAALKIAYHGVEAERLFTKVVVTSTQVHGSEHRLTKAIESKFQLCKVRVVGIKSLVGVGIFQALRYEEDGKTCIVKGPITTPRNTDEEEPLVVATEDLILVAGTPIVCHGLGISSHLNGKIGDLQSWDEETDCYKVHFEDKGLELCSVTRENVRILFELPDE